jgi:hypothetical protein
MHLPPSIPTVARAIEVSPNGLSLLTLEELTVTEHFLSLMAWSEFLRATRYLKELHFSKMTLTQMTTSLIE